ncbi:1-acyl-sn-glycerol-3-phosphate acyltransferase [Micrococcales bacterium KH10]|nr:1-acyl-sn-glycerol-3-phosphate acyltransferase [Micrococcales bacterium KH10]
MARPANAVPGTFGPRWSSKVGWFLAHVVWRTRAVNRSAVPWEGPVILAGNHTGVIDGPVLLGVAPRRLHILVKQEMFDGFVGAVLRGAGQIPVDRNGGRSALATARAVLKRGGAVGIFPEGSRGAGQVDDIHGGAAWLALNTGAPVVPVAILGTRRAGEKVGVIPGFRRRLVVQFGEPVAVRREAGQTGKEALESANEQIRAALAALVQTAVAEHQIALP